MFVELYIDARRFIGCLYLCFLGRLSALLLCVRGKGEEGSTGSVSVNVTKRDWFALTSIFHFREHVQLTKSRSSLSTAILQTHFLL